MWPVRPSNSTCPRDTELQRPARLPHPRNPPRNPPEMGGMAPNTPHSQQEQQCNPLISTLIIFGGEKTWRGAGDQQHEVQDSPNFLALENSAPHPLSASLHPKAETGSPSSRVMGSQRILLSLAKGEISNNGPKWHKAQGQLSFPLGEKL